MYAIADLYNNYLKYHDLDIQRITRKGMKSFILENTHATVVQRKGFKCEVLHIMFPLP